MELAVGKVVGRSGQGMWGQVHDFVPEEGEKRLNRGRLVAAVSVSVEEGAGQVQTVALGREVLSRLQEMYYGVTDTPVMEQLKTAIIRTAEEFPGLQIAAAVFLGQRIHLVTGGGAGVWVTTGKGKQGWLVKPERPNQEFQIQYFEGKAEQGKVLVLGTHGFWALVSERLLVAAVTRLETNFLDAVEMIVSEVQAVDAEGGGAGTIIRIQNIDDAGIPETEPEVSDQGEKKVELPNPMSKKWAEMAEKMAGKIYVRGGDKQTQRKKMLVAGLVFMGILLVLFGIGQLWNQKKQVSGSEREKTIQKIQYDFDEAKAMASLNPARSRELLLVVKQNLQTEKTEKQDERLVMIESEWEQIWNEAAGIVQVTEEELLDLGLVRDGMKGNSLAKQEDELLVLDSDSGRIAGINVKTAAGKILAGESELEGATGMAVYPGRVFVSGKGSVWEISQSKAVSRIEDAAALGKAADIGVWAGNIYLLVNNENGFGIRRYQSSGEGFGSGQEWLGEEETDNLPAGISMAIDGNIWIAGETTVFKFSRGAREDFGMSGWDQTPERIDGIFTDENTENLYIWEKGKNRIVVAGKEGAYKKQLTGGILGKAEDVMIDENGGKGYILAEGKVWRFDLNENN